jgi:hypothetical protein
MRLDSSRQETITNLGGTRQFGMNASAKAFQILSSGIYERKREAIVRELSCNAFDSHVMAGKADVPFRVQLPTGLDPKFVVEDFGVGLSEEEVYSVYTTYFESTKTESNEVVGALGLGSKTPFSYTDSFTITARKEGIECVFTASIGQSGVPEVVKLYQRPWLGENGVTVSVEVAPADVMDFRDCADKVFGWFEVKPTTNRELSCHVAESVLLNVNTYGYHLEPKTNWRNIDCKVIMGNVAYSLDLSTIKSKTDDDLNSFIGHLESMRADFFFRVPIGDADVAASRETLSLDDRTKENLQNYVKVILNNFEVNTKAKFAGMSSIFEAYACLTAFERKCVSEEKIDGYSFKYLLQNNLLSTDIHPIDNPVMSAISKKYDLAFFGYGNTSRSGARSHRSPTTTFDSILKDASDHKTTVVVNDCGRKVGLKAAIKENHNLPKKVLVISDKNTKVDKDLEALLSHITYGCYKIVYTSSFWDGKLSTSKSNSKGLDNKTVKANVLTSDSNHISYRKVDLTNEDTQRWAYSDYDGHSFITVFGKMLNGRDIVRLLKELDLDGIVFYNGNNEAKVKRIISNSLSSLIELKATKSQCETQTLQTHLKLHLAQTPALVVVKGFDSFKESIEAREVAYPFCCEISSGSLTNKAEREDGKKIIDNRMKVFDNTLKLLKDKNVVLAELLSHNFKGNLVEDIKDFITYLNQKKGK